MYGGIVKLILVLGIKALRLDLLESVVVLSKISAVPFGAEKTVADLLLASAS